MAKKGLTAKETAEIFREVFYDQYEDEENYTEAKIKAMTEKEARSFVEDHIKNMIAINGREYLWAVERQAIKDLHLQIKEK